MNRISRAELEADGAVRNPNMWIGDGWMYCKGCKRYTFHHAMSHPGERDCYEVCGDCDCYYGEEKLKNGD